VNTFNLQESVDAIISNTNEPSASFRVVATQNATLSDGTVFQFTSRSNVYTFNLPSATFTPSAFTPNGDGMNDIFKVELRFVTSGSMMIYDRWGSIIFETNNLKQGWDGTEASGSRLAPVGTYAYKIQTLDDKGTPTSYTGSVTLIR
jgi:gliding motility-associated-like protein